MNAIDLAALIRARRVSAREVMAAHLEQIDRLNPRINAIVARLDNEQCLTLADAADARSSRGNPFRPSTGCPLPSRTFSQP